MATEDTDHFFSIYEDKDFDFPDSNKHMDVPVLSYRWSRNTTIASCSIEKLVDAGEQAMREMGLKRVDRSGHHLRGDTETGQRVKMTAIKGARGSMFLLMTAGMPGTREKAKQITSLLATQIETLAREQSDEA